MLDLLRRELLGSFVTDKRIPKLEAKHAWQKAEAGTTAAMGRRVVDEFSLPSHGVEAIGRCGRGAVGLSDGSPLTLRPLRNRHLVEMFPAEDGWARHV